MPKMRRGPSGSRSTKAAPRVKITGCTCITAVAAAMGMWLMAVKKQKVAAKRNPDRNSCIPRCRVRRSGPSRGARMMATTSIMPA